MEAQEIVRRARLAEEAPLDQRVVAYETALAELEELLGNTVAR